jgi:hypothetical protein
MPKRGRPSLVPTKAQRDQVKDWSSAGIQHEVIAKALGFSHDTLKRHFPEELEFGRIHANVAVAKSLFQMATVGENVAAAIFWAKTRMGWKEGSEEAAEPKETHFHFHSTPKPERYSVEPAVEEKDGTKDE